MKPLKNIYPLAAWILRLALVFYVFATFLLIFREFNWDSQWFYLSAINLLAAILLLTGGLAGKHSLTVVAAIVLLLAALYQIIFLLSPIQYPTHTQVFLAAAISLYFISRGNQ